MKSPSKPSQKRYKSGIATTNHKQFLPAKNTAPCICVSLVGRKLLCRSLTRLFNRQEWPGIIAKNISVLAKNNDLERWCLGDTRNILLLVSTGDTYLQGLLESEQVNSFLTAENHLRSAILLCSGCDSAEIRRAWEMLGVRVFLGSDAGLAEIHKAILAAADGRGFSSEDITELLSPLVDSRKQDDPLPAKASGSNSLPVHLSSLLTERETEIASLVSQGYSNEEIAEQLFISVPTVKSHLQRMFKKLHIKRRGQINALNLSSKAEPMSE